MPSPFLVQRPATSSLSKTALKKKNLRPKGLWKARVTDSAPRLLHGTANSEATHDSDSDNELEDLDELEIRSSTSSTKRRRLSSSESSGSDSAAELYYWDYSRQCTPPPKRESSWTRRTRIMDTSSLALKGTQTTSKATCDYEDWEDLKDLFSKAVEQYEGLFIIRCEVLVFINSDLPYRQ